MSLCLFCLLQNLHLGDQGEGDSIRDTTNPVSILFSRWITQPAFMEGSASFVLLTDMSAKYVGVV